MAAPKVVTIADLLRQRVKIVFRPLGKDQAHGAITADTIELDPRSRMQMAKILLHELLHAFWPLMSEHAIEEQTALLWRSATWREKATLYRRLGRAHIWAGEDAIEEVDDGGRDTGRPDGRTDGDQGSRPPAPATPGQTAGEVAGAREAGPAA